MLASYRATQVPSPNNNFRHLPPKLKGKIRESEAAAAREPRALMVA